MACPFRHCTANIPFYFLIMPSHIHSNPCHCRQSMVKLSMMYIYKLCLYCFDVLFSTVIALPVACPLHHFTANIPFYVLIMPFDIHSNPCHCRQSMVKLSMMYIYKLCLYCFDGLFFTVLALSMAYPFRHFTAKIPFRPCPFHGLSITGLCFTVLALSVAYPLPPSHIHSNPLYCHCRQSMVKLSMMYI